MAAAGADLIDLGAESTRPGAEPVTGRVADGDVETAVGLREEIVVVSSYLKTRNLEGRDVESWNLWTLRR